MKWSKPLMMDNDGGIDGCTGQLNSYVLCNPEYPLFYKVCVDPTSYYDL